MNSEHLKDFIHKLEASLNERLKLAEAEIAGALLSDKELGYWQGAQDALRGVLEGMLAAFHSHESRG